MTEALLEQWVSLNVREIFALLPIERVKPSRLRDKPCAFPKCAQLVLRASTYCRHHLGVLHGGASARTYSCSASCQRSHTRCGRCRCLVGGTHVRQLRDGLCYLAGAPSCWSDAHGHADERLLGWVVTCGLCGRSSEHLVVPPAGLRCQDCGSGLLLAEAAKLLSVR